MCDKSQKTLYLFSTIIILTIAVGCSKPQEPPSRPVAVKKPVQHVVTNTHVRKEISNVKPETNWFAEIDSVNGRLAGVFRDSNGNPVTRKRRLILFLLPALN